MIPLPPGPFGTAIVDPARLWIGWSKKGEGKSPQKHYGSCPPLEATLALPLGDIMVPNSALFLWAIWPLIFDGPEALMKAW